MQKLVVTMITLLLLARAGGFAEESACIVFSGQRLEESAKVLLALNAKEFRSGITETAPDDAYDCDSKWFIVGNNTCVWILAARKTASESFTVYWIVIGEKTKGYGGKDIFYKQTKQYTECLKLSDVE